MASRHVLFEILEIECHECVYFLVGFQDAIFGKPGARRRGGKEIFDGLGDATGL